MHPFAPVSLALLGLGSLTVAQSIDPSSVSPAMRTTWCNSQVTACPLLCSQLPGESTTAQSNTCDPTSLAFSCVCSNGQTPNASQYSQTIPYFECTEFNTQCVNACAQGDSACQSACRQNHPCGAQNPTRVNTSTSSTMSATSVGSSGTGGSEGPAFTGLGGSATATATGNKNAAVMAMNLGQSYGLGLIAAGIFAGFALIL